MTSRANGDLWSLCRDGMNRRHGPVEVCKVTSHIGKKASDGDPRTALAQGVAGPADFMLNELADAFAEKAAEVAAPSLECEAAYSRDFRVARSVTARAAVLRARFDATRQEAFFDPPPGPAAPPTFGSVSASVLLSHHRAGHHRVRSGGMWRCTRCGLRRGRFRRGDFARLPCAPTPHPRLRTWLHAAQGRKRAVSSGITDDKGLTESKWRCRSSSAVYGNYTVLAIGRPLATCRLS